MSHSPRTSTPTDFLAGGGEMGAFIRAKDWSSTPLGPIEEWPQSLRTAVSICIASNFPISMAWGPDHVQIYNDGYWPICGAKHPHSMGQDFSVCWASAWPAIGDAFDRALAGESSYLENQRMFLDRFGYLEETFFTFSFSPIRDESGGVGGLFHPVTETTAKMLSERRTRALRDLAARAGKAQTVAEALDQAAETLSEYDLDLPFVLLYQIDGEEGTARLAACTGLPAGSAASPTVIDLRGSGDAPWPLAEAVESGAAVDVEALRDRFGSRAVGPYPEPPDTALVLPFASPGAGGASGVLAAGVSSRLPLNEAYRGFYDLLTSTLSAAVANARAYEEERKRAEALAELDRAKTAFFSNVSHEFRTPLTLMLGPLGDLLEARDEPPAPSVRRELELIHRNALRLLRLVNTLLDFSRIEAGRAEAVFEPVDLARFTADLASSFRSAVEKAGLTLIVDAPPLPGPLYIDREMWEKIVLNLLSNAFKFTLRGEIAVTVRTSDGGAELEVRDTGEGIPPEELPHVFERFHRVKSTRGRTHEGTGIGLALVRELVKLHGGEVGATSVPGKGSRFQVRLPGGTAHLPPERLGARRELASTATGAAPYVEEALRWIPTDPESGETPAPVPGPEAGPAPAAPRSARLGARILLADDNADMRAYLVRLLEQEGYAVVPVPDGAAALAAARKERPDLVLTDVMMPGMDGFELLGALREHPVTRDVPIVLLSARAGEEASVEGLEAGADDYLIKPFSARELLARIRSHLEIADLRRESVRALERGERRYRRIFQSVEVSIWEVDLSRAKEALDRLRDEGVADIRAYLETHPDFLRETAAGVRVLDANDASVALVGATDRAHLLDSLDRIFGPETLSVFVEELVAIFEGRARMASAAPVRTLGGETIQVAFTVAFPDDDPELRSVLMTLVDITDRQRAEEALREAKAAAESASRAKSEFLAVMSHEMRTPLNAIGGYAQLLEMGIKGPLTPRQRETIERIRASQAQLGGLIDGVLDLARIESGVVEYAVEDLPLARVLGELSIFVEPQLEAKGLEYEVVAPSAPIRVRADREKLRQILLNLLSNAVKFTPRGGRVRVHVAERADGSQPRDLVFVQVSDSGPGIPPDRLEDVFEPFVQVGASTDGETYGTGLGLAISRDLARGMGGSLRARSVAGEGATFTLALPRSRTPAAGAS